MKRLVICISLLLAACGDTNEASSGDNAANPWSTATETTETVPEENSEQQASNQPHPAAEPPRKDTFGDCTRLYPGGRAPEIVNAEFARTVQPTYRVLCYRSFAVGHSGRTRTALWSAEMLEPATMRLASQVSRDSEFVPDENLPPEERAELEDYRHSGYDRGHLAPSADMPSPEAQQESFRLSNIVPQNGEMNGGAWRDLEMNVRREARKRRVYVVTGPIFHNSNKALKKRVLVPTALFKAMFAVDKGVVVFITENNPQAKSHTLSLDQFRQIYGIDPFPALQGVVRKHNIALGPIPVPRVQDDQRSAETGENGTSGTRACREFQGEGGHWYKEDFFRMTFGSDAAPLGIRPCQK